MEINYILIGVAVIVQFVLGAVWYSPLMFGKLWMQIHGMSHMSKQELEDMQKSMAPFYGLQLLLTILTTYVLAMFLHYLPMANSAWAWYGIAGWVWLGFIAPIQIQTVVWGSTQKKFWVKQIFVMLSYQLVGIMLAAYILSF